MSHANLAPNQEPTTSSAELSRAIDCALARVPPLWPLRHFVAVNPFVGLANLPFPTACGLLERINGRAPLQSPADYRRAYAEGQIKPTDLIEAAGPDWTTDQLLDALDAAAEHTESNRILTVADLLDQERPRAHWSAFVADEISKWCATYFDENQTTWNSPWRGLGLFRGWREAATYDRNPEAFGLTGVRHIAASLPADPTQAIDRCLRILAPRNVTTTDFLHRQLMSIPGWAGYVQYRVREDAMRGTVNPALKDLLAIRLAYDTALHQAFLQDGIMRAEWRHQQAPVPDPRRLQALAIWQTAYESGYQRQLAKSLAAQPRESDPARPTAQAVFCIDVRSELLRRHLEAKLPGVQTIGFAGFFGFPVAHRPAGQSQGAARCPVLLVPSEETCDALPAPEQAKATTQRAEARAWKAFQNSAASCFTFVEAAGLAFGAALAGKPRPGGSPSCSRVAPDFTSASIETKAALCAGALRNMSLVRNFARLVLICGHGSQSANNPHASSLDCGACGGHAGDVNARLAAACLNDPAVRARLAAEGLAIPPDTYFLAGLHNTTTDDVLLYDLADVPPTHLVDLVNLRRALALAGGAARRERAASLGLAGLPEAKLDDAVRARSAEISEVRPEWGLANNAAFVAAPRARTRQLNLRGRVFLHDYDPAADRDDKVLTLILCAPVVVASWINLQYYASRVDPERYGAGNKVLHNVAGGIGVLEGNGGDLKVGLPLQSIHDGEKFVHEPRRLSVYIEAAPMRIGAVLDRHPEVKQLFDHGWLHLFALEGGNCYRYGSTRWLQM
jgi:hypothetical protein